MIDTGVNLIQLAQPELTFGQGSSYPDAVSSRSFEEITKFIKIYGACSGPYVINGKKFSIVGVASVYEGFRGDAQYVDYTMTPAGTDSSGVGVGWNSLEDAFQTLPPQSIKIGNLPHVVQLDNFDLPNDHMSVFAATVPDERNNWLVNYDSFVRYNGFHFALPAFRPTMRPQSFSGYPAPLVGVYPIALFLPLSIYGGPEDIEAYIFSLR
jgi:hypothetical protein